MVCRDSELTSSCGMNYVKLGAAAEPDAATTPLLAFKDGKFVVATMFGAELAVDFARAAERWSLYEDAAERWSLYEDAAGCPTPQNDAAGCPTPQNVSTRLFRRYGRYRDGNEVLLANSDKGPAETFRKNTSREWKLNDDKTLVCCQNTGYVLGLRLAAK